MEKTKVVLLSLLLCFSTWGTAQEEQNDISILKNPVRNGQLYGGLSFALGFMTENTQNLFVQGDLGYFVHKNISIRADAYYFINSIGDRPRFDMNHQIFFGADFHLPTTIRLTPHVGLQPGVAISRSSEFQTLNTEQNPSELERSIEANPLISTVFGLTYHAPKYFYAFVEGRYLIGTHQANTFPTNLDELRIQFGLGWFFNFK